MNRSPRSPIAIETTRIRRRRIGCDVFKLVVGQASCCSSFPSQDIKSQLAALFFRRYLGVFGASTLYRRSRAMPAFSPRYSGVLRASVLYRRSPRLSCESFRLVSPQRRQRTQRRVDCRFQIADRRLQIADFRLQISECDSKSDDTTRSEIFDLKSAIIYAPLRSLPSLR